MIISDTESLPSNISDATSWESAILLLAQGLKELEATYNTLVSEVDSSNLISLSLSMFSDSDNSSVNISLTDIPANFSLGKLTVDTPFTDNFLPGSTYPWNSGNALECLIHVLLTVFKAEKTQAFNPDQLDRMVFSVTQNTEMNSEHFTISAEIEIPVLLTKTGEDIQFRAEQYLSGVL